MKALLISVNWAAERVMHTFIADKDDAAEAARRLRDSIAEDWPGYEHFIEEQATKEEVSE